MVLWVYNIYPTCSQLSKPSFLLPRHSLAWLLDGSSAQVPQFLHQPHIKHKDCDVFPVVSIDSIQIRLGELSYKANNLSSHPIPSRSRNGFIMFLIYLSFTGILLSLAGIVSGLGTSCTVPLGAGTSGNNDPFWMQSIKHQGTAPFNVDPSSYTVFRNVKVSTQVPLSIN